MRKPTSEKVLRLIEIKTKQGFEFTVSRYSDRDMKLRRVIKCMQKQRLVNIKCCKDLLIVSLNGN